jgi:hypothetical protein
MSGSYGFQGVFGPMCYIIGPPIYGDLYGQDGLYGQGPIYEPLKHFKLETPWFIPTQLPWLTPSYTSPSWNYLNNWLSPIQNYKQIPLDYSPSWNNFNNWYSPITNYPQTQSIPLYPWNTYMNNHSRLNNLRKDLLAFFRKKGILNDKQSQRLLSTPFEKA